MGEERGEERERREGRRWRVEGRGEMGEEALGRE